MKTKNKLISAILTASLMLTSVAPLTAVSAGAATTTVFSGSVVAYSVYPEYFMVNGAVCEPFVAAIEKSLSKSLDEITFTDLNRITTLSLSGKQLTGVPKIIEYMERLKTLNLSNNLLVTYTAEELAAYKLEYSENDSLGAINNLDLSDQIYLVSVDLSDNYLTVAPSWFVSLDITSKKIANNLINATGQRKLTATRNSFYYMLGDTIDVNALKEKVASSLLLDDKTALPLYFYDPLLPTYVFDDDFDENIDLKNENVTVTIDLDSYIKDGVVTKTGTVSGNASLRSSSTSNTNITTTFKVYLLDENDISSAKVRLESVIAEAKTLKESDYTASSWQPFKMALATAQSVYGYADATVDMTKRALDNLTDKMDALVKGLSAATKKIMNDLIALARTLKEESYTSESWLFFSESVALLTSAYNDSNTSLSEANRLIERFQSSINALVANKIVLPATATKAEFESIYGESKTLTYTGTTRDGFAYTWTFNGKDITTPADANLEVKLQSAYESDMLKAIGSTDFLPVQIMQKGAFPAPAKLKLEVSKLYKAGTLYLYSFDTVTKKAEKVTELTAVDGFTTLDITEGGEFFLSATKIYYDIISTKFKVNPEKLIISGVAAGTTVKDFKTYLENGDNVKVYNADGTEAEDTTLVSTSMTANIADGDTFYTIAIIGDIDGDGAVTIFDALMTMKALVGTLELTYTQRLAADYTNDSYVRVDDALAVLKIVVGS